jgi:DNA-binding NarL/FixJ family response regulator
MSIPAISVDALRHANSYEATGSFGCRGSALDALIMEHQHLVGELEAFRPHEAQAMRLSVEGYSTAEIARRCRVSKQVVRLTLQEFRIRLLRDDPRGRN